MHERLESAESLLITSAVLHGHHVREMHVFLTVDLSAKVLICVWSPGTMIMELLIESLTRQSGTKH